MKLYACNWHGYYQSQNELQDMEAAIVENSIAWQEALRATLHEVNMDCAKWREEEPLCKSTELPDARYEQWLLNLLYQEQKKPLPQTLTSLEADRLFQKVNDGLLKSKLAILWEPQAYLPVSEACVFDYADLDEEPMCFGTLKTYCKYIRSLPVNDPHYQELREVLEYAEANSLMLILENDAERIEQ